MANGDGLRANYFDNSDFTNLRLNRVDPIVNFNWGNGSPSSAIAPDTFSARWTGQVEARFNETYTFHTTGDDGIRLWVNGQQIINGWVPQAPTEYRGQITLQAGRRYDIRLEYYERTGGAVARLEWSSRSQVRQVIPQAYLYSGAIPPADTIAPTASLNVTTINTASAAPYQFTVTYSDNSAIDIASIDNNDIRITGPNGFNQLATRVSVNASTNGTPRTATYQILAPGGSWDNLDNGTYTVALVGSQVRDINGNFAVAVTNLGSIVVNVAPPNPQPRFNYAEALQKSIYFYDAQRSGRLPANNRVEWRGDSALFDGSDVGRDLVGGWYDAGDRIKFSRTTAYSAAMLAWGVLETPDAYQNSGQMPFILDNIKWATDYLLKAFTNDQAGQYEFYTQVGSMGNTPRDDHQNWVPAEVIHEVSDRPSYKITPQTPDSATAGQTAAAFAAASVLFRQMGNITYADLLLTKAERMFNFANTHRGMNRQVAPNGQAENTIAYTDVAYHDELLWGATWLHKASLAKNATYGNTYLVNAEAIYNAPDASAIRDNYYASHNWQWVDKGAKVLLAELTNKAVYRTEIENYLNYWTIGHNGQRVQYTPDGLAWLDQWGSLRYATTQSFVAMAYTDLLPDGAVKTRYQDFSRRQVNYALGENKYNRSYMLGFGSNPMRAVHHATANGPWASWDNYTPGTPNSRPYPRHILYGALLGGPDNQGNFTEDLTNYVTNEVALDYNAAITGMLARMYKDLGGAPLNNFPTPETRDDQFFVEASVNNSGPGFVEVRALVNNRSSWPAKVTDKLSFRYYFTLDNGINLASVTVSSQSFQARVSSRIQQYRGNIYFVDVDLSGTKIFPGGYDPNNNWQPHFRKEVFFRLSSPNWNSGNDWSFQGMPNAGSTPVKARNIVVFDNGVKVFGDEPPATWV